MKRTLVAALVVLAAVVYLFAGREATDDEPGSPEPQAGPPRTEPAPPLLEAGAAGSKPPRPAGAETEAAPPDPVAEAQRGAETRAREKAGETFTPVTALKIAGKEDRAANAKRTRTRLQDTKPLRARWSDAPLQDVLRQLSKQTGMVIALGPLALEGAEALRVSDPFEGMDDAPADPSVWDVVQALATRHGFVANPWRKGVLITRPPDPKETQVRIYSAGDLVQAAWGNVQGIEPEDRLSALFADLARDGAGLAKSSTLRMHGSALVVRATREELDRLGEAFDTWRSDPKAFRKAYDGLIAKRHPTVSGAPPRKGAGAGK